MRIDYAVLDAEYQRVQQLTDLALQNAELFRNEAERALRLYTPRERAITLQLTKHLSLHHFFEQWQAQLRSVRHTLRASEDSKNFHNALDKYLLLEQKESSRLARTLVRAQDGVLVERFIESLNLPDSRKGRDAQHTLRLMLAWSDEHLLSFQEHYVATALHNAIGEQQSIHAIDPYAGFFSKARTKRAIRKERTSVFHSEKKQLRVIKNDLQALLQRPFVSDLLTSRLEAIQFFSARATYEKKLASLPEIEAKQLPVRSALMMKESSALRRTFYAAQDDTNAETLPVLDQFFERLIRSLFTISTVQKNQLMNDMKRYRELIAAQDAIVSIQSARRDARANTA